CGELQQLVPGAAVRPALPAAGRPASGVGPAAGGGQHTARPPAPGGEDTGAAPPWPAAAQAAPKFRGADGATAVGRGPRDLYPAGERGQDGHGAESDVPGGEEASGAVPAAGDRHQVRVADGVPERPRAQALAVQAAERLTDI